MKDIKRSCSGTKQGELVSGKPLKKKCCLSEDTRNLYLHIIEEINEDLGITYKKQTV